MINIDTLDNVIALVVVILLLSLIVQSIQTLVKKILKVKSKQLEDSLLDLFDAALRTGKTDPGKVRKMTGLMPGIFRQRAHHTASEESKALLAAVKTQMKTLGRVTARGELMLDSLSKSDLLNILDRVAPAGFGKDFVARIDKVMKALAGIEATRQRLAAANVPAQVKNSIAALEQRLAPMRQHYEAVKAGDQNASSRVIISDVVALRGVVIDEVLDLLGKADALIVAEQAHAPAGSEAATALGETLAGVRTISTNVQALRTEIEEAFSAVSVKLDAIRRWFDTIMQGFEERYHRGMRTWSIIIGALVVIVLNANVFTIYRNIAKSDVLRGDLTAAGKNIAQRQEAIDAKEKELAKADAAAAVNIKQQLADQQKEIDELVERYTGFGFHPLAWAELKAWWSGFTTGKGWWGRRADDARTLAGWLVMTMLLSLGAPFWHDTLESLFGVKNLLRRKNEQRNVENDPGAGNPKP